MIICPRMWVGAAVAALLGCSLASVRPTTSAAARPQALVWAYAPDDAGAARELDAWKAAAADPLLAGEVEPAAGYPSVKSGAAVGRPGTRAVVLGVCSPEEAERVLALVQNVRLTAVASEARNLPEACPRRGSLRRLLVKRDGRWGYVDLTGELTIPAIYDEAQEFAFGLAAVRRGQAWEYIRPDGSTAFPVDAQGLPPDPACKADLAQVYVRPFEEDGLAVLDIPCIGLGGAYRVSIDRHGRFVRTPISDATLLAVRPPDRREFGYVDASGKLVLPYQFEDARPFRDGRGAVKKDGKWGVVDGDGRFVVPPTYEDVFHGYVNGLCTVRLHGKWGFIDTAGKLVVPPAWDEVTTFSAAGIAGVMRGKRHGFVDRSGKVLVPPTYDEWDEWGPSEWPAFPVKLNGKFGFVDARGSVLVKPAFDEIKQWREQRVYVVTEGTGAARRQGVVSAEGKLVVPPRYAEIFWLGEHLLGLQEAGGQRGVADLSGRVLMPPPGTGSTRSAMASSGWSRSARSRWHAWTGVRPGRSSSRYRSTWASPPRRGCCRCATWSACATDS